MFIVRAIQKSDLNSFIALAFKAKAGITSLPKNEKRLGDILEKAVESFAKQVSSPGHEVYLFVLEDTNSKTVCGVSGIYALTGDDHPLHYFKIRSLPLEKKFPETPDSIEILDPVSYKEAPTEICSLFLDPSLRKEGLGKMLSFSRFLFMAQFPERFTDIVYALMRSYIDEDEENPFWNHVGRKFLDISFKQLLKLKDEGLDTFPPLLANFPILTAMLPSDAVKAIGNVNQNTLAALHMLKEQGFTFNGEIDAIDGGPKIEAERKKIKAIQASQLQTVIGIEEGSFDPCLISNTQLAFRCCFGTLKASGYGVILSSETAKLLQVKKGDVIRFSGA